MKLINATILSLALGSSLALANEECVNPDTPVMPDGASSSMEQMIAGQKAVKAYQASNIEYMACLEARFNAAELKIAETSGDEKAANQELFNDSLDAYNAAVSSEETVAGQFNTAIREYKEANPK